MGEAKQESRPTNAPPGQIYVCAACGKRSYDIYGDKALDPFWDESCFIHSILCYESLDPDLPYYAVSGCLPDEDDNANQVSNSKRRSVRAQGAKQTSTRGSRRKAASPR